MNMPQYKENVMSMAQRLRLQPQVTSMLENVCTAMPWESAEDIITKLTVPETALAAQQKLVQLAAVYENNDGMAQLAVMLAASETTMRKYKAAGINETVFYDTMGCFKRFLSETHARTGKWVFDRAFWTWRQLSCLLLRLGTLEFEYRPASGIPCPAGVKPEEYVVCVHIPSDAALTRQALDESYALMHSFCRNKGLFFQTHGKPAAVLCGSWLLSPSLHRLLAPSSHILTFADDYHLYDVQPDNEEFYEWLFGTKLPTPQLPQGTTLQRTAKAYLEAGGKIGMAYGELCK